MILHEDRDAFGVIIEELAVKHNKRRDVLEKDYYVTLLLKELSEKEKQGYAYFKGGTALYKALRSIRRFSEDIDLTVYVEDCETASQAKKRLEGATLKYKCLPRGINEDNRKGSITSEYLYDSLYALDKTDALQRFGKVKIEATSFTVSEPTSQLTIAPHLYELASSEQKAILESVYGVAPFVIQTISMERIFIDKIFAAQFYFSRGEYGDVAKHVYDLTVLFGNDGIREFLKDGLRVLKIVGYKRKEELSRKGGVPETLKMKDFTYFDGLKSNKDFDAAFATMQQVYVFDDKDILEKKLVLETLEQLKAVLPNE